MERSGTREVVGSGIASRVVGPTAVERMVGGRYEWRDGGLRPMRGARKRHWEEQQVGGRVRQRPNAEGAEVARTGDG